MTWFCMVIDAHSLLAGVVWDFVTRNWALMSMAITLVVLVVVPTMIIRKYLRLIINIFDDTPPPLSMPLRDNSRLDGEVVDFLAFDGHRLNGLMISREPTQQSRGTIIFAHEFKSDAQSCARYCKPLLTAGYDVFSFDFRGHGQSADETDYRPRQWPSDREVADMLGAIAYVESYLESTGQPPSIGLFGISRGASAAIIAATEVAGVKAIVTDGAFSSDTTLEHLMKRWAKIFAKVRVVYENHPQAFWRFLRWLLFRECSRRFHCSYPSVRKALGRLTETPIFMIHGEKDSYIPVSQTRMLYDYAHEPKYIWIVPGAKHNQGVVVQADEYAAKTLHFFNKHLAGVETDDDLLFPLRRLTQPLTAPPRQTKPQARPTKAGDTIP
ncbi:MAG: alpha/beta fold hydrolase [Phycisphaerae bacterium]|nr:alpha/beta fold hydrolase [Phycisphaerae bacterium]